MPPNTSSTSAIPHSQHHQQFPSKRSTSQSTYNENTSLSHTRTHSSASTTTSEGAGGGATHSYHSSLSNRSGLHIAGPPPSRAAPAGPSKPVRSQYPRNAAEKHVEYVLVASFDIDRGSVMEHQYPGPVGGDEHMLAELMLPEGTHMRSQDWTIFFLHKDAAAEEEMGARRRKARRKERADVDVGAREKDEDQEEEKEDDEDEECEESESEEDDSTDGPPLVYVLNLVNTKQDTSVKRGAVVKAMAICTRHSFLHIYKPLLLLALEQYFAHPTIETLASLYDAVNSMDLSLMPRLNPYERFILQSSDAKDLFIEKFEAMIAQRMATTTTDTETSSATGAAAEVSQHPSTRSRYGLPRDTHEFESVVRYANIPIPIKVPVALSPETVGDFSLIKLITTFSTPHSTAPIPFTPTHPHLTTNGALTHPIIVLLNALLTQKRIIFLGHNLPSSEVADAVLAACALASGGLLRGFTRHAFPYTDLTKIDDLLKVPGFIAGVTNPVFNDQPQWWDVLCDLSAGRVRISSRIEAAPLTEGVLSAGLGGSSTISPAGAWSLAGDATGDAAFMHSVLRAIEERHGENAIRAMFRKWVLKFTRVAASFEEAVYGASALQITATSPKLGITGHGYVWPSPAQRLAELAANATRIEGWRTTRAYYNFVHDLAGHFARRPVQCIDLPHLHDRLSRTRLSPAVAGEIYLAICAAVRGEAEVSQLLATVVSATWGGPGAAKCGLFYLVLGLVHPKREVREEVAKLLGRVKEHEAGRWFWGGMGRWGRGVWGRVMEGIERND
ncbi:hypothetical protein M433DRAFT_62282 [Acidomyces richmondensis BFW]|nr:MAG: hypothetical protein FE78DRAFT_155947 [Acidomyces sp. 'richmondensis']KYG47831.1 hypothetical protein M433DRAFT_62282 [Acidomyces richmondensis BFW]